MKSYLAFTKKEFTEAFRNYKLFILAAIFLLLGMMNPITAKITPQMLKTLMPAGISIKIAEPTALDSWAQFFKNVPQMGLIVLVIVFSGIMSNEFSRGTLINILTKGLARRTVILSKFTMASVLWTACYILCSGVTYAYTAYFWKGDNVPNILFAVFCLWLFGILLLALMMLSGVLFKSGYGSLLFTGGFAAILLLLNIAPKLQKYNPVSLASNNMALLTGKMTAADFRWPVILAIAAIIAFLISSIALFNRKQV